MSNHESFFWVRCRDGGLTVARRWTYSDGDSIWTIIGRDEIIDPDRFIVIQEIPPPTCSKDRP